MNLTMSDFEKIKRGCLKRGELWEDPDFPATQSSVFYHQKPPFQFVWKRPKEISSRPLFTSDTPNQFDVLPGKMGDKWLVCCLGILHVSKGLFYRVVPADQTFAGSEYAGIFRFRLWWCGEWTEVVVDDRLPTVSGKLAFVHCQHSEQYWPCLLEKAYAKCHGSYEALKYGTLLDGLADMTGGITDTINMRLAQNGPKMLSKLLEMTSIVTCTVHSTVTPNQIKDQKEKLANGILIGVNYRVCGLEKVALLFGGEPAQLVRLRNPVPCSGEYLGAWSSDSTEWNDVSPHERDRLLPDNMTDSEFWMCYSDFAKTFTHLEVVHLDADTSKDEPTLNKKRCWLQRTHQGIWQRGVTAGGCRNNPDTFHINPQLHLTINDSEEVIISLNQHSIMEPKVIGFTIYQLQKSLVESANRSFFKKNKSLINSQYTNSRQVSHLGYFECGNYLILPTTFEPAQEAGFTFRVYSCKSLKLKLLDTIPSLVKPAIIKAPSIASPDGKSFSQYEAVFLQLADEHRTVNAFELQELLDACLPNDYIKSCACLEVCRQIVIALDIVGNGRLRFSDFKDLMCSLKSWQSAFKNHTKEKTGILKAERLRDALQELGFHLNTDVISILVLRYMRKDGTLRFGDFVSAILHLSVSFTTFETKDPLQNGTVKFTLADWLKSSLTC